MDWHDGFGAVGRGAHHDARSVFRVDTAKDRNEARPDILSDEFLEAEDRLR